MQRTAVRIRVSTPYPILSNEISDFPILGRLLSFDDLPANFPALVGGGVNVEIPAAGHQIGSLRVGQGCGALDRACRAAGHGDDHSGVLLGRSRTVEMRGGRVAGQSRIVRGVI